MTREELKRRQLTGQHLITPSDTMTVVRDLLGVQAQFMSNAIHSLKIRCHDFTEEAPRDALVKNWTIRGTVHVFAKDDLPLFLHCHNGKDYRSNVWNGYSFWNQRESWALSPERQAFFSEIILSALEKSPQTREELKAICRENGMTATEESSMFEAWGGGIRELCERGFLNYTVSEKKTFCLAPPFTPIPEEEAKLEMARRYFTNIAPATIHDAMYFFHTTAAEVKKWLSALPVSTAECERKTYFYIENGKSYDRDIPDCIFLAGFDGLMLGYQKKESLYLKPEHLRGIFNLAGIVMPAVLLRGEVVGKWRYQNRKLSVTPFIPLKEDEVRIIKEAAESLWHELRAIQFTET